MRGVPAALRAAFGTGLVLLGLACGSAPPPPSPTASGGPPSLSPTASPTSPPAQPPSPTPAAALEDVLPTPTTTDVVLLVGDSDALSAREQQWLSDLLAEFGRVDALDFADASLDRLDDYFTIFVIDQSAELDVGGLVDAYAAGLTIHLIGPASAYQSAVAGGAP